MKRIYSKIVLVSLLVFAISGSAVARECTQCMKTNARNTAVQSKAAGCKRAQSTAELNINNVRALINGYGNMWYDGSIAQYHVPKNANTNPLYCAALWIGGTDVNKQLRLAALCFGQYGDDYWPGPLKINGTASIETETCNKYDKHWIITKAEVQEHMAKFEYGENNQVTAVGDVSSIPEVIRTWPATGDGDDLTQYLAPFFDADGNGVYNPEGGDYPYYDFDNELCPRTIKAKNPGQNYVSLPTSETTAGIVSGGILSDQVLKGDQTIWWVFNDMGNTHTESKGSPIGLEIRAQAFAFSTNDEINNMTFYSYEIINRSTYRLQETYFSQWVDPDLGYGYDDYVGCDVRRGLGYCYNGDEVDGPGSGSYSGIPPAVGIDFFQGPYMDPDGRDNPKINIPYILSPENSNDQLRQLLEKYKKADGTYDTIAITDDADLFFNVDFRSWYFVPGDAVGNCAINGVNFGNNIIDDERFGMRRFVYYNNATSGDNSDPSKANDYYNLLRGYWKNNQRMTYGGNAYNAGTTTINCDFMYPGDSDPWHWGTDGVLPEVNPDDWTEVTSGSNVTPGDRRFMQSAGPFTLEPGALNYITVGIPFAQASSGNAWSSVLMLREIDDVCQALFENCFKVLDGPDAPTITCQELKNEIILYLHYDDPKSNNYGEKYSEIDPAIVKTYTTTTTYDTTYSVRVIDSITSSRDTIFHFETVTVPVTKENVHTYSDDQRSFKFEGYQIYQLKDASVSIADIRDITKARLVAQCDIENYYDSVVVNDDGTTSVNSSPSQPIGTLVNFTTNSATGLLSGSIMVEGANRGIQHVFRITTDQFASGVNTNLVNNREYYFIAVAYAQNRYKEYSQTEAAYLDGQKEPYLAGRKNERGGSIVPITAIPHDPIVEDGGKLAQSEFGMCPNIIRLEGYGNGGSLLRLTNNSIEELMGAYGQPAKAPGVFVSAVSNSGVDNSHMENPCIIANPQYAENYGPVNVRVIDPLKIREGNYNILFKNTSSSDRTISGDTRWCIINANGGHLITHTTTDPITGETVETYEDTVWSDFTIARKNEQIFLDLGIAITLVNPTAAASDLTDIDAYSDNLYIPGYFEGFVKPGALLNSSISYADQSNMWLTGIPDNDASMPMNWIRSGSQFAGQTFASFMSGTTPYNIYETHLDEDYFKSYAKPNANPQSVAIDKDQIYEGVVNGMWAPYGLVSTMPFHPGFNFSYYMPEESILDSLEDIGRSSINRYTVQRSLMTNFFNRAINFNDLSQLPSVRIVFTADTSKWTRCPVIEMCDDYTQSEGNARKFSMRKHLSVDKLGRTCEDASVSADVNDPNNPAYISEYGMGWFPGYAINTTTGERLNIMFGEDSRFIQYNGRDMMWNPVSETIYGSDNYIFGGRHYIYVMNACSQPFATIHTANGNANIITRYRTPSYDAGRWAAKMLSSVDRLMNVTLTKSGKVKFSHGVVANEQEIYPQRDSLALLYASVAWVNMPLVNARHEFKYPGRDAELNRESASNGIPCDVTIDIDIRTPYGTELSANSTTAANAGIGSANRSLPAYQFRISAADAVIENRATAANARESYVDSLLDMISVVPNPYYSYSKYETSSQLETKVRIINLPTGVNEDGKQEGCYVKIYTVDGTLVRTLGPTTPNMTTLDWDLHNHTGIPIAGGMYLIHVSVPGIGERVIKWFGTMRPVDLNSYQF